ncbi:MAG: S-layer homology domain-containing protein [Clostridia bacterium]|nr:S-layer homology domain-containing protein [Clostridia bacterium]
MKKLSIAFLAVFLFSVFSGPVYAQNLIANDFTKSTPRDTTLSFSSADFTQNSNPPQGKTLVSVKFNQVTNSSAGDLKLNGSVLKKGSTVFVNDLDSLVFVPVSGYEGEAIFTWTANYGGAQSPYPGAVVITIGSGNGTPSVIPESTEENKAQAEDNNKKEENNKEKPVKQESKKENNTASDNSEKKEEKTETKKSYSTSELKPLRYEDMLTHWGAYSAGMLASRGYVIGEDYGNNFYFHPDEKINRFHFVLMVNAIFGVEPKDSLADNPFSDKGVPAYVMKVGIASYEYGIISGTKGNDGRLYFNPYDTISRAEAITVIDYALRLETHGVRMTGFKDAKSIPDWAEPSVNNLDAYGIIQGYGDNTIRPNEKITRAQAAEMVWQTLKFLDSKRDSKFTMVIYGD